MFYSCKYGKHTVIVAGALAKGKQKQTKKSN